MNPKISLISLQPQENSKIRLIVTRFNSSLISSIVKGPEEIRKIRSDQLLIQLIL